MVWMMLHQKPKQNNNNNNNKETWQNPAVVGFGKVLPHVLEDAEKMQSASCPAWDCHAEILARKRDFHFTFTVFCHRQR